MLLIHVIRSLPMMREGRAVLLSSVSEGLLEAFRSRKRRISLVIEGCGNFVGSAAKNLRPFYPLCPRDYLSFLTLFS